MIDWKLKLLIVVLTNAGGTGKTHVTEILDCLARLAGLSVCVVDADQGCRGYINRNGKANATVLNWNAGEMLQPAEWSARHLAQVDVGIFDLGANFLSMDTPAAGFLNDVVETAQDQNIRTVFAPIDAPDKVGARLLAERLYTQFSTLFEVFIVKNDNRGTGNFGPARLIDPQTLSIPFLDAGYESVRLRQQRRLDEVIEAPEDGYAMASAAIASRLLEIANNPIVEDLFGTAMRKPLEAAAQGRPGPLRFVVATPADARDEKLRANMAVRAAHTILARSASADPQALQAAFEAEREALLRFQKC
ncbi:hypothetical protein [Pacificimonas flava]|uniref:CobQ/CobB/MinD/ParA nucleotide binding domain-containing protein n=1 Tax=Pacificimonas flava TaxID=1234595 RepID=M2U271_9SPHN|nr:hypothetical protein [Pacificimonas flava]EMD81893.1 hypothetical protein C725_2682 [Pacificimonas flava]MBB5281577.1 hypothetical protein [Pacificimonas flava]